MKYILHEVNLHDTSSGVPKNSNRPTEPLLAHMDSSLFSFAGKTTIGLAAKQRRSVPKYWSEGVFVNQQQQ